MDRASFLEDQRVKFRLHTHAVIRLLKDERFEIEDDHREVHRAYNEGQDVNFGFLVTLSTRKKIFVHAYDALRRMRALNAEDVDLSRLPRLIRIHKVQMDEMNSKCAQENGRFLDEMLDSLIQNLEWLRIILKG